MDQFIIRLDHPDITPESVFQTLRMTMDLENEDTRAVLSMLEQAAGLAVPKAMYQVSAIEEKGGDFVTAGGVRLTSPLVRKNLDQASRMIPYAATCGVELEQWSAQFTDPLEVYWADGIKMRYLAEARRVMADEVRAKYFPKKDMSAMSPGSLPSWPLRAQEDLFRLLGNVTEAIGVRLTDSCLMLPSKSISGFFFSSESHYENCQFCPILSCPNRRAPFRRELENQ